jgi:hypothetical protein
MVVVRNTMRSRTNAIGMASSGLAERIGKSNTVTAGGIGKRSSCPFGDIMT